MKMRHTIKYCRARVARERVTKVNSSDLSLRAAAVFYLCARLCARSEWEECNIRKGTHRSAGRTTQAEESISQFRNGTTFQALAFVPLLVTMTMLFKSKTPLA
jgi:hypothetical protein